MGRAKMRTRLINSISILCAASCLLSLPGCFLKRITKTYTYEEASEELLKCLEVKDWDGEVPDGMEVKYVMTRKVYMDYEGHLYDYRYENDSEGRETAQISDKDKATIRVSRTFNDDGTIASKEKVTTGEIRGYRTPDFKTEFEYNGDGQLVSYSETMVLNDGSEETSTEEYEYENGHLIRGEGKDFQYNDKELPYYDYVAEVYEDYEGRDVRIVKYYYDENWVRTSRETDESTVTYKYENGVLISSSSVDQWGYVSVYDAEEHLLTTHDKDGNLRTHNEYNEHGDNILQEDWRDGKCTSRNTATYEYDDRGNHTVQNKDFWSVNSDGEERSFSSRDTYEYDEHGLLISEVTEINGRFSHMTVYSYEAILVPAGSGN